jgi:hypothetical protein
MDANGIHDMDAWDEYDQFSNQCTIINIKWDDEDSIRWYRLIAAGDYIAYYKEWNVGRAEEAR